MIILAKGAQGIQPLGALEFEKSTQFKPQADAANEFQVRIRLVQVVKVLEGTQLGHADGIGIHQVVADFDQAHARQALADGLVVLQVPTLIQAVVTRTLFEQPRDLLDCSNMFPGFAGVPCRVGQEPAAGAVFVHRPFEGLLDQLKGWSDRWRRWCFQGHSQLGQPTQALHYWRLRRLPQ